MPISRKWFSWKGFAFYRLLPNDDENDDTHNEMQMQYIALSLAHSLLARSHTAALWFSIRFFFLIFLIAMLFFFLVEERSPIFHQDYERNWSPPLFPLPLSLKNHNNNNNNDSLVGNKWKYSL